MSLQAVESPPGIAPVGLSSLPVAWRPGSSASKASQVLEPSCSGEVLLEVRWLAHQLQDPPTEELSDHAAWLLLGLLQGHCSSFNDALVWLRPNARQQVMSHLIIKCFPPDQLLTWSDLDGEAEGIAAAIVLKGSLQLLGAAPGQEVELPAGGELPSCRAACGSQGAELLVMLRKSLQEAAELEEQQEALRLAAREVLYKTERMARGIADLQVLRRYLDTLPLFHDLPDEKLLRLCQHLQLLPTIQQGECLLQAHHTADGLRLLLRGTAAASIGSSTEPPLPLWCHQAWFCEDAAIWPRELFADGVRVADVVAIEDCDVLFLPRAECTVLPIGTDMVRSCFSQIVALKSSGPDQAVLRRRALLVPNSPLIQAQEEYWSKLLQMDRDVSKNILQQLISLPSLEPQRPLALEAGEHPYHPSPPGSNNASIRPGASSSFLSGIEVASLMRIPSCELEEEDVGVHQSYAYGAILDWAEGMTRCLLPGIHGALRPALQLLPRRKRPELGPYTQLLQLCPGQLLRHPGRQGIKVLLSGEVGHFEALRELQLPRAMLKAMPEAVERRFLSKGIPITEHAKGWLQDLASDHADAEDPVAPGAMSGLADAVLQVAQRRFKELKCPGEDVRSFVSSAFLDRKLLGEKAVWVEKDLELLAMRRSPAGALAIQTSSTEAYVDISEIGQMKRVYRPGERISAANETELVALTSADILILDPSALLADTEDSVVIPSTQTRSKGRVFSIKELFRLGKLLRRIEAFEGLECRALVDVCHSALHFETVDAGQYICCEGHEATGFFEILGGTASSSSNGAFLFQLREGSAVGEDVLLEQDMVWPFSVVAETSVEIVWVDAKLFKESCLDLSGRRAARRRILEAADWRLEERTEDFEAFLQTLKVPLLKTCDKELCFELLKQANMLQIPAGGQVVEMLEGDSAPLYIILKGAIGRHAVEVPEEATEDMGDSNVPIEHLEDAKRQSEEITSKRRRLAKANEELEELRSRHRRVAPLDRPLQESLRVHFLMKLVTELSGELQALPEVDLPERRGETLREPTDGHTTTDGKVHGAGVFLTSPDAELPDESDELEELLDKAVVEYYEGDSFGWEAASAACRYVAHQDAALLVLRHDDLQRAQELCEGRRRQQRGQFLQRCLGDEDVAMRLLPLFREERCHRGTVLVKAGSAPTSLWLILSGSCSQVKEAESKETHGRFRRASLGVLQEGQFVGLTSLLLQQPEPLTVICATEVQLLRADNLSPAKLTPKVIEVLKSALRQKGAWLSQRLETLAELPAKLDAKAERLRSELYEARVPLVSDSPFLRRKHQALLPGMVALEAVCKHFGNEVHPESEWIYMQKERDFFMHMQLSSGFSEPLPKAEVPEHGAKSLNCITSPATANVRFGHHQALLWKKLRMDEPTEVLSPKPVKTGLEKVLPAPGPMEAPEPAAIEEMPTPRPEPVTPRKAEPSPEEQFRRRPRIILSSNSRVFQNCRTEVTMNERRAVKEAKSKAASQTAVVREPLVTPRDQGQSRSIAKRHWQKGFALAKGLEKGATTPPKPQSPANPLPERRSDSSAEAPARLTATTQLVPMVPADTARKMRPRRLLTSQQSRESRTPTEEYSLSIDSRTFRSRQSQS